MCTEKKKTLSTGLICPPRDGVEEEEKNRYTRLICALLNRPLETKVRGLFEASGSNFG